MTSRDEVVGCLTSWLAPGGWLLVEAVTIVPAPQLRRAEEGLIDLLARTVGTDLTWARRMPAVLERAGLTETSGRAVRPRADRSAMKAARIRSLGRVTRRRW